MERLKNILLFEQYTDIKKNWKFLWELLFKYNYEIANRLIKKYKLTKDDINIYPAEKIRADKLANLSQSLIYHTSNTRELIYKDNEPYNNKTDSI